MGNRAESARYIGNIINELRNEEGWSQAKLAKKSGVSPAAISLLEKGERVPSLVVTRKLAATFKVPESKITGAESTGTINKETQAFFRNWQDLEKLDEIDQDIIRDLIKKFKEREQSSDKGSK